MKKYRKVTEMEVLEKYVEEQGTHYSCGSWLDWISVTMMANLLNTSKYQVQKAYKSLLQKGYMEIRKVGTHYEDYYNGLYDVSVPILFTNVYVTTEEGRRLFEKKEGK